MGLTFSEKALREETLGQGVGYTLRRAWQESVMHRLLEGSTELAFS